MRSPGTVEGLTVATGERDYARAVRGNWAASMQGSLAASLANPEWWAMSLAAFLVRGGILVILVPIVSLPSEAGLTNAFAPSVEMLVLGGLSLQGVVFGTLIALLVVAALTGAGRLGSWLDLALVREASSDPDLELDWSARRASSTEAFGIRMLAHLPTLAALVYAGLRFVGATYDELLAPGSPGTPLAIRVVERAPDAALVAVVAWLLGETLGPLVARRLAAGEPLGGAIRRSLRQVGGAAGLATLVLTDAVLVAILLPFMLVAGNAWLHLRDVLLDSGNAVQLSAALVLFVASWILGLATLGAALAWRATAWTVQVAPRRAGADVEAAIVPAT